MFKNRSLEVKVVKTPKTSETQSEDRPHMTPYDIHNIVCNTAERLAFAAGSFYVIKKVVDTSSEIVLIVAKTKIK